MTLVNTEVLWVREGLNGPVLVEWGEITGFIPDLVAAAGTALFVFSPVDTAYVETAKINLEESVLSLAVSAPGVIPAVIALGTEDRISLYSNLNGVIARVFEVTDPGARFADLALADLDGDGLDELVAAAENREALFIYRLVGQPGADVRLELLAIYLLPGLAQRVAVLMGVPFPAPLVAAAYRRGDVYGIQTLYFTEEGFLEGPSEEPLPSALTAMTAGDLRAAPGEELAWGGADGRVRVVEARERLFTAVITENLGSSVAALKAGIIAGEPGATLVAGTPEGYLFGFRAPVERSAPDWAVATGRPVNSLALSGGTRVALGTADGSAQVWRIVDEGVILHVVRPGETLYTIAAMYNTTPEAIARANALTERFMIFPGQELAIPV